MDEAEVVRIRRDIEAATNEGDSHTVSRLLGRLESLDATPALLKATRIGFIVNALRKHSNVSAVVQAKAKDLTRKWTKCVGVASSTQKIAHSTIVKSSSNSSSSPVVDSEKQSLLLRTQSLDSVSVDSLSSSVDAKTPVEISFDPAYNPSIPLPDSLHDKPRDTTVQLFSNALSIDLSGLSTPTSSAPEQQQQQQQHQQQPPPGLILYKSRQIEQGLYSHFGSVNEGYKAQFRVLLSNMKIMDNVGLRVGVLSGSIKAQDMAVMTKEDLMPESVKLANQKAKEFHNHWASSARSTEATTDEFKCGKCGKRKCTYYQKQTRSADEPMTTFVTCQNCGNKWKFC